jgi:hypothetical protein
MQTTTIYGYKVENGYGHLMIEAIDAPVSELTGFAEGYAYVPGSDTIEYFDADANALYPCSPIRELALVIDEIDDQLEMLRAEDEDIHYESWEDAR